MAAADGYRGAIGGSSSGWWWVAGGIVVVGGGGYLLYRRSRRRKADAEAKSGSAETGEPPGAARSAVRAQRAGADRHRQCRQGQRIRAHAPPSRSSATRRSAQFRTAFESARESLTAAFEIRQRIDDDIPEDEPTRRAMMAEILSRCADAAGKLDSESDRFDALRDLRSRLPQVLAELPAAIETQTARLPVAQTTLDALRQRYSPAALQTVAVERRGGDQPAHLRPDQPGSGQATRRRTGRPAADPAAPRPGPAGPDTRRSRGRTAVLAAGAAQEAVGQAQTMLGRHRARPTPT